MDLLLNLLDVLLDVLLSSDDFFDGRARREAARRKRWSERPDVQAVLDEVTRAHAPQGARFPGRGNAVVLDTRPGRARSSFGETSFARNATRRSGSRRPDPR